jgi:hypothetical protein
MTPFFLLRWAQRWGWLAPAFRRVAGVRSDSQSFQRVAPARHNHGTPRWWTSPLASSVWASLAWSELLGVGTSASMRQTHLASAGATSTSTMSLSDSTPPLPSHGDRALLPLAPALLLRRRRGLHLGALKLMAPVMTTAVDTCIPVVSHVRIEYRLSYSSCIPLQYFASSCSPHTPVFLIVVVDFFIYV